MFARETGASVISLRYHNVYGPRAPLDTPYSGVASIFLSSLRRGEAPQVFEDGGQQRDFVHVTDVARANMAALTAPAAGDSFSSSAGGSFDVCNVASGGVTTVLGIATGLWEALGRPGPAPTVTGAWRLGDVRHVVASPAWAMQRLGFRAEVALEDGLAELAHLPVPG